MSFKGWFGFSKESHKRPHSGGYRHGINHSPYSPYYPTASSPQHSQNGRFDKAIDVLSAPQTPISDQFFQKLIVFKDFSATDEKELTVRKGERVEVVQREEDRLLVRNERGKQGYVPSDYCAPPIASSSRRARSNSRSSMPLRPVASGEDTSSRGSIPMYASHSAGRVKRSPCEDSDQMLIRRINSPPNSATVHYPPNSAMMGQERHRREGSAPLEPKHSPSSSSGVASLSEQYSPALNRSYSQDALETEPTVDKIRSVSLSQTPMMTDGFDVYRKNSSSDDSGTMELSSTHYKDYASTIRNGDASSDDGSSRQGRGSSASGNTTPSIRDRPLPSPPKSNEEVPPPIPPRHTSLDRAGRHQVNSFNDMATPDDIDPYAQPVDTLSECGGLIQPQSSLVKHRSTKSHVDVQNQNTGIESPYSEVYRPSRGNKRPINLPDDHPHFQRHPGSFTRHRSPNGSVKSHGIERRGSPQINGVSEHKRPLSGGSKRPPSISSEKRVSNRIDDMSSPSLDSPGLQSKGMVKFRKCLWGVYVCLQNFDACDENEVSVTKGESVLVFNQEDNNWFWVVKHKTDNSEGFVPSSILSEVMADKTGGGVPGVEPTAHHHYQSQYPSSSSTTAHRPRASTTSVYPTSSSQPMHHHHHRSRLSSTGAAPMHQRGTVPNISSSERLPPPPPTSSSSKPILASPSSPPPPYAEKDPIGHPPPPPRQSIPRNRPSYPGRTGRVSMPHSPMYPPGIQTNAHVTRSSTHLSSPHVDNGYPTHVPILSSPAPVIGGTLV
ncbi:PREDICTED: uncharacterized protein LOC109586981 isoform X2 [Amphimedon queenslandica]|uniref:SH3 domain-containing protein n=1 Tax=Amphimedon queenslandica TaxID=400682 RepID=A0AAN0JPN4_AMPQE|nr:PREDICTED: uncharacterized protein LOC109586981 isoform X2 [Amphimedon queenslandica]|eukprot:XP_019858763.1 PREDICTED: uncharacterized protein LOC109586981 isoform X2 [Amphimedon queenslandica]